MLKRAVRAVARSFIKINRIGGVMINVLASSVIDCGFKPQVNQKNLKLVFAAYPLSTHFK